MRIDGLHYRKNYSAKVSKFNSALRLKTLSKRRNTIQKNIYYTKLNQVTYDNDIHFRKRLEEAKANLRDFSSRVEELEERELLEQLKPEIINRLSEDDISILYQNNRLNSTNTLKTIDALNDLSSDMLEALNDETLKSIILKSSDKGLDKRIYATDKLFKPDCIKKMKEIGEKKHVVYNVDKDSDANLISWLIYSEEKDKFSLFDMHLLDLMKDSIKDEFKTPENSISWIYVVNILN